MTNKGNNQDLVTRREAILRVSAMLGGAALVGQGAMLAACVEEPAGGKPDGEPRQSLFTDAEVRLLDEIAETILPETQTPGAKAAGVGPFMAMMVADTYTAGEQQVFRDGLQALDAASEELQGKPFLSASPDERLALLRKLDAEQLHDVRTRPPGEPAHYFRMMKELTLLGYFTSEIGYTQAMRYVETPGRYEPCEPYEPGDKAWAPHA